ERHLESLRFLPRLEHLALPRQSRQELRPAQGDPHLPGETLRALLELAELLPQGPRALRPRVYLASPSQGDLEGVDVHLARTRLHGRLPLPTLAAQLVQLPRRLLRRQLELGMTQRRPASAPLDGGLDAELVRERQGRPRGALAEASQVTSELVEARDELPLELRAILTGLVLPADLLFQSLPALRLDLEQGARGGQLVEPAAQLLDLAAEPRELPLPIPLRALGLGSAGLRVLRQLRLRPELLDLLRGVDPARHVGAHGRQSVEPSQLELEASPLRPQGLDSRQRLIVGALLLTPFLRGARRLARAAGSLREGGQRAVQRTLRANAIEGLFLRLETRQEPRHVGARRPGGEQALFAPPEEGLRALPEPRLAEAEAREEAPRTAAPQPGAEDVVRQGLPLVVDEGVLAALASGHAELLPLGAVPAFEHRRDGQALQRVEVGVRAALRDPEQEPFDRPQRRALPRLVRTVNDVEPAGRATGQIQTLPGEGTEGLEVQRADPHERASVSPSPSRRPSRRRSAARRSSSATASSRSSSCAIPSRPTSTSARSAWRDSASIPTSPMPRNSSPMASSRSRSASRSMAGLVSTSTRSM